MKFIALGLLTLATAVSAFAQGTSADFQRAAELGRTARNLVVRDQLQIHWASDDAHLIYRVNTAEHEHQFFLVDLATGTRRLAFDHDKVAQALAKASGEVTDADLLPLDEIDLNPQSRGVLFRAFNQFWLYDEATETVVEQVRPIETMKLLPPRAARRGSRATGESTSLTFDNATADAIEIFWIDGTGGRRSYGHIPSGSAETRQTYAGHAWLVTDGNGESLAAVIARDRSSVARIEGKVSEPEEQNLSPDGKWDAFIRSHDLYIREVNTGEEVRLTHDGTSDDRYEEPLLWSPDSQKLVTFRGEQVKARQVHIVESSPADQLQPKLLSFDYRKPGDPIPQPMPRLFHIDSRQEITPDNALFNNPWHLHEPAWSHDSTEFSFVYNQRGHQLMRIVGISAESGDVRTIYEERSDTFIDYSQKFFLHRLPETNELIWTSEKDGYNHLYLIDEISGEIKNAITRGDWNVREVVEVDVENRLLLLRVSGLPGQDPYHIHYLRVGFDGIESTRLTQSDGTHRIEFSPSGEFYIATWSRVDQPPVTELRRALDGTLVAKLERADDSALLATGWTRPERFTAKGRDGETDIYGFILRPSNFDPNQKYPVVENIYAGPHDHFVPKAYSAWMNLNAIAELGFIVVKIDGMGTNWRSKAFQDVAWKNLSDAGFPDRIAWIRESAETRPWMDLSRVGIYGGSAGGQSAVAALLHHGDFYKVAVADCGCHDNRMDKIWWNEAWMGWPVDDSYEQNSNVVHAAKLTGKLLLIVGELDRNVDPASTYQLVHALQQAGKHFDFIPIMGAGHGAAETEYGKRRRADFLIRNLHGLEPRQDEETSRAL